MMLKSEGNFERSLKTISLLADLCVVGGGLAGLCAAITAARSGLKVVLINDRPILGGNSSSEVRLWILGATSHMGNNNRWAREGGVIDEILVENTYRNPDGNPLIYDTILLEKITNEPNIHLLLNTSVYEVAKETPDRIASVHGFCSQNSTQYNIAAPLFVDASGDGIVGFLAGAAFRMGAETSEEFGEKFAPEKEYGGLLGHSLYFYTKDVGRPIRFVPPSFALRDITQIPHYRKFNTQDHGCQLWWIEYGGRLDTIHDSEAIKWELWRVIYGVWNYIKNSGEFPGSEALTLEWVGQIPGKRESRRFEGDYMLTQQDLVEQRTHYDAVSYGGWAIDLHPADGVYSDKAPCNQWHTKGLYEIPYRALYSRNIENLFLAGRLISASHVAFGSTRVMATCAHNAQAVGIAASLCREHKILPRQLGKEATILHQLQQRLQRAGQFIPNVVRQDSKDLAQNAKVTASSTLLLNQLKASGEYRSLSNSWAMLLPVKEGRIPQFQVDLLTDHQTELKCELRTCSRLGSFTPDVILASLTVPVIPNVKSKARSSHLSTPHFHRKPVVAAGIGHREESFEVKHSANGSGLENINDVVNTDGKNSFEELDRSNLDDNSISEEPTTVTLNFETIVERDSYVFVCLLANSYIKFPLSEQRITGILSVCHASDKRVALKNIQSPPNDIGIDAFELWCPKRRPNGQNIALQIEPSLECFSPVNVTNGITRPTTQSNAWVADPTNHLPRLTLTWTKPQTIRRVELSFDTDFDHPMESVLMIHPEHIMPLCVRYIRILDDSCNELVCCLDNYQTRRTFQFENPITTRQLHIDVQHPSNEVPASIFEVRCYS